MTLKNKLLLLTFNVALCCQVAIAQRPLCSQDQQAKAIEETAKLQTWGALYQSYRRYADCDDGAVAEGYDEVVARLLRDHWDTLPEFAVLLKKDKRFKSFAFRHVSLTSLDMNDLKKVGTEAVAHCPIGQDELCRDLHRRVEYDLSQ
jgi:hypothetical protein